MEERIDWAKDADLIYRPQKDMISRQTSSVMFASYPTLARDGTKKPGKCAPRSIARAIIYSIRVQKAT